MAIWVVKSPDGKLISFTASGARAAAWRKFCHKAGRQPAYWWDRDFDVVEARLVELNSAPAAKADVDGGALGSTLHTETAGGRTLAAGASKARLKGPRAEVGNTSPRRSRVVRLHPLPAEHNEALVEAIAMPIYGAVNSALDAHAKDWGRHKRHDLAGSIRKRIVNQLVCTEGETRIRNALLSQESEV